MPARNSYTNTKLLSYQKLVVDPGGPRAENRDHLPLCLADALSKSFNGSHTPSESSIAPVTVAALVSLKTLAIPPSLL